MSRDNPSSQSFILKDSNVKEGQLGGIAGHDMTVTQTQHMGTTETPLKPENVAALLSELESILHASNLPEDKKIKALNHISTAKEETQAKEPNKVFAAESLKRATTVLKEAGATVEAGTSLWDKVKPILETVSPWLKVASVFFF
jgi:hypothetical protein